MTQSESLWSKRLCTEARSLGPPPRARQPCLRAHRGSSGLAFVRALERGHGWARAKLDSVPGQPGPGRAPRASTAAKGWGSRNSARMTAPLPGNSGSARPPQLGRPRGPHARVAPASGTGAQGLREGATGALGPRAQPGQDQAAPRGPAATRVRGAGPVPGRRASRAHPAGPHGSLGGAAHLPPLNFRQPQLRPRRTPMTSSPAQPAEESGARARGPGVPSSREVGGT